MEATTRIIPTKPRPAGLASLSPLLRRCKCCGVEKPLEEFRVDRRSTDGLAHTCNECLSRKHKRHVTSATLSDGTKVIGLEAYTPRQLMLELRRRGYDGELTVTERKTIKLSEL